MEYTHTHASHFRVCNGNHVIKRVNPSLMLICPPTHREYAVLVLDRYIVHRYGLLDISDGTRADCDIGHDSIHVASDNKSICVGSRKLWTIISLRTMKIRKCEYDVYDERHPPHELRKYPMRFGAYFETVQYTHAGGIFRYNATDRTDVSYNRVPLSDASWCTPNGYRTRMCDRSYVCEFAVLMLIECEWAWPKTDVGDLPSGAASRDFAA